MDEKTNNAFHFCHKVTHQMLSALTGTSGVVAAQLCPFCYPQAPEEHHHTAEVLGHQIAQLIAATSLRVDDPGDFMHAHVHEQLAAASGVKSIKTHEAGTLHPLCRTCASAWGVEPMEISEHDASVQLKKYMSALAHLQLRS
jgi:hypothetical protein